MAKPARVSPRRIRHPAWIGALFHLNAQQERPPTQFPLARQGRRARERTREPVQEGDRRQHLRARARAPGVGLSHRGKQTKEVRNSSATATARATRRGRKKRRPRGRRAFSAIISAIMVAELPLPMRLVFPSPAGLPRAARFVYISALGCALSSIASAERRLGAGSSSATGESGWTRVRTGGLPARLACAGRAAARRSSSSAPVAPGDRPIRNPFGLVCFFC